MDFILIVFNLFIFPHILQVEEFQKTSALDCKFNKRPELTSSDNFCLCSQVDVIETTQLELAVCYSAFTLLDTLFF